MSKSSGRKRTKAQRDADLEKIASMHFRGLRQKEIAEKFGLTQAQISHDLKEIYKRMPLVDRPKSDRYRKRNLGELAEIKRECWDAWARSKQNKEVQIQEKSTKEYKGKGGNAPTSPTESLKAALRSEEQCGNPAFLAEVRRAIQEENKLLGLCAPEENETAEEVPINLIEVGSNTSPQQEESKTDDSLSPSSSGQLQIEAVPSPVDPVPKALAEFAAESGKP